VVDEITGKRDLGKLVEIGRLNALTSVLKILEVPYQILLMH
jgi:hypothetical protein